LSECFRSFWRLRQRRSNTQWASADHTTYRCVVLSTSSSTSPRVKRSMTPSVVRPQLLQLGGPFNVIVNICRCVKRPSDTLRVSPDHNYSSWVVLLTPSSASVRVTDAQVTLSQCPQTTVTPAEWSCRRYRQHLSVCQTPWWRCSACIVQPQLLLSGPFRVVVNVSRHVKRPSDTYPIPATHSMTFHRWD